MLYLANTKGLPLWAPKAKEVGSDMVDQNMDENRKTQGELDFRSPISETALLTLYFKAQETRGPDRIIEDPKVVEILEKIGVDMSRFRGKRMSQVGTVIRTRRFDRQTRRILAEWDKPVVVYLACGLDDYFLRTDSGKGVQVDLDLPDIMAVRERFLPGSERNPQNGRRGPPSPRIRLTARRRPADCVRSRTPGPSAPRPRCWRSRSGTSRPGRRTRPECRWSARRFPTLS